MKTTALILSLLTGTAYAFTSTPTPTHQPTALFAYVPDGLTAQEYNKIKKQEAIKYKGVDLGRLGPRGFKSRSMEAWQKAYERGEADHAFAPFNFQEKLRKGLIAKKDIPYMVRGGSWDNSDVFGAKRLKWLREDKDYARGGYKKQQSASLLGSGPGFDWAGKRTREENLQNKIVPGLS
ncbi:hypothetical protein MPSEU_000339300 [Mayamaea pseudoterrestris]|nr:hypothetical protein MPSEU_000339300 [Mayamaea pseudoterrestris]